jgi:hypothetical protein
MGIIICLQTSSGFGLHMCHIDHFGNCVLRHVSSGIAFGIVGVFI